MSSNSFSSYSKKIIRKGGTQSYLAGRKAIQCITQESTFTFRVYNQEKTEELGLNNPFSL